MIEKSTRRQALQICGAGSAATFAARAFPHTPLSRDRVAARRKAGAHPLYTEYAGIDHNCWEWAFTEPELVKWLSTQGRG